MRFEGKQITVSVFGQSHGPAVGVVVDGLPAGIRIDPERLQRFLNRRAPGRNRYSTPRREADEPEFLSGLVGGVTCGAPLCAVIRNTDTHSADYAEFADTPRPSHADWPASVRYGKHADLRGGGPFSARLTAPLCVAGGIALQWLEDRGVRVGAHVLSIGEIRDEAFDPTAVGEETLEAVRTGDFPVIRPEAGERMREAILRAGEEQDSLGGCVECAAIGLPVGLGGPLFEGLESPLSAALFAIPAVRAVEFGLGTEAALRRGSDYNDAYTVRDGRVTALTNHSGGLTGGLTNGMPLLLRITLKPTPSIGKPQRTVSLSRMEETELRIRGRHDPCVVPRAVPVAEAMTAMVLADRMLADTRTEE